MNTDVIIIGGGSTGLYMAKLLEEAKISYMLIEDFHNVGGQCKNLYPNKYMYDVAGLPPITGEDFTNLLLSYINKNNIILNEKFLEYAQIVGMVLLFGLMIYANANDWLGWGRNR